MKLKGLHDIKTFGGRTLLEDVRRPHIKEISVRRESVYAPRTWVFKTEPKLTRFEKRLQVEKVNEPEIDMVKKTHEVVVISYLPGVDKERVHFETHGDILDIEATYNWDKKRYYKEILLPFVVDEKDIKFSFKDSMLELILKRRRKDENYSRS